jgi:hypothetical protein
MHQNNFRFILWFSFTFILTFSMAAQSWDFIKEKDGIKIYTRKDPGKSLKSYKGVANIKAPAENIFAMIEDVNNTDWWDKNLTQIKVLMYEKNKRAQYYLVYDLPWPVTDRDLYAEAVVTIDPVTGVSKITAGPLHGTFSENKDLLRIKEYRQIWTITPLGKNLSQVLLEGYVDPAGSIPDWITNLIIVDSPVTVIRGIKERLEKKYEKSGN